MPRCGDVASRGAASSRSRLAGASEADGWRTAARRGRRRCHRGPGSGISRVQPAWILFGSTNCEPVSHGASQVQGRDGRPVVAVAQLRLGDGPQRIPWADDIGGGPSPDPRPPTGRATGMGDELRVCTSALVRQRATLQARRTGTDVKVRGAASAIRDRTPAAMRAAIRSASAPVGALTWPRRTCSTTERVSCAQQAAQATQVTARQGGQRDPHPLSPLVAQPVAQGTAHHGDQHRGCGREDHQRGQQRARHVGDPRSPGLPRTTTHPGPDRSSRCRRRRRTGRRVSSIVTSHAPSASGITTETVEVPCIVLACPPGRSPSRRGGWWRGTSWPRPAWTRHR